MVKSIINVRRSSICWRGRRNRYPTWSETRNHGYDVIVGGELFTDYSDHLKLVTLNSKNSNQQALDATVSFPVGGCQCASLAQKTSPPKSQDAAALQQIKERGAYLWRSWWYPSGNRPLQQYLGLYSLGAGYGQFEHKADSLIAKFKEAGGTVREIDVWAESPRLSPLWLSASSSACHGLLIITVITPLPTKPSATKMPENWSWRTRQLLTCRCVSVMLLRRCKIHEGVSWCQSWKWCSAWWCRRYRRRLHIKAVCQSVREATHHRLRRG